MSSHRLDHLQRHHAPAASPRLRLGAVAAAAVATLALAAPASAIPLLPGTEISPIGTSQAVRPELAGLVLADTLRHFSISDGAKGTVHGYLQDRVYRSTETGTLVFSQRIVLDAGSSPLVAPGEWTRSGATPVTTDVDYRTDGLGSLGASSVQRGATGSTVRFKLPRAMGPGESTYFHEELTNALAFNAGGQTVINGTGLAPITLRSYRPAGTPQPYYTATPLGYSSPYRVFLNDYGQASLTVGDDVAGVKTVLWQPSLPDGIDGAAFPIPMLPGFPYNEAGRINNLGQVTGTNFHRPDRGADPTSRAFLWTPSTTRGSTGHTADLGTLAGGTYSVARGINDRGEVAGGGDYPGAPIGTGGVPYGSSLLWSADGVHRTAPTSFGSSYAINESGAVVGFGAFSAGTYQGYTWTPDVAGGSTGTTLSVDAVGGVDYQGPGADSDINDSGASVGSTFFGWPAGPLEEHGYLWTGGHLSDLGAFEMPEAINNAGVAVGSLGGGTARLYRNGVASTLRYFVSPAQAWLLGLAFDINDKEQITALGQSPVVGPAQLLMTPVRISSASPSPCGHLLPYTMTVRGTGFTASASAQFDGMALPTTRVSANELSVTVPATLSGLGCGGALFIANGDGSSSTVKTF